MKPFQRRADIRVVAVAGLFLVMLAGCATNKQDAYFLSRPSRANVHVMPVGWDADKVAVMPFKGPTELIGTSVSDMFVIELLRAGRYDLVERSQMAAVLSESELAMAGLSEAKAMEVGNMLGADAVIIGTVDEYGTIANRGNALPAVGVTLRMIDCRSGKVLWSAGHACRAEKSTVTLAEHARDVVHDVAAGLYREWKTLKKRPRPRDPSAPMPHPNAPVGGGAAAAAPVEPPPAPAGLTLSDMGLREVKVTWKAPADRAAALYRIERAEQRDGPFACVAKVSPSKQEYVDRGERGAPLKDGATYYYRLVAEGATGLAGGPSAIRESLTAPPPDPPSAVKASTPAARAVCLAWTPPASEGVVRYVVERAAGDAPETFVKAGEVEKPEFHEGGTAASPLMDRTAYRYRITAINRVGAVGAPSEPVQVVTRPPPAPVSGLKPESGGVRCVPVAWEASAEEDVIAYEVYRASGAEGAPELLATVKGRTNTQYLDGRKDPGTLADETTYHYAIVAVNGVGARSEPCARVAATTRPVPPVVAGLAAQSDLPRAVRLTWDASPDEKVIGYVIERATGDAEDYAEVATVDGGAMTAWEDRGGMRRATGPGGLADGAVYAYRIAAFNTARARSAWSGPKGAQTKPAPAAPLGVTATQDRPKAIVISWDANEEADIAAYVVEARAPDSTRWSEVGRVAVEAGRALTVEEPKRADGEARVYRVKAVDRDTLESAWSAEAAGAAKPAPGVPAAVVVAWTEDGAKLSWTPPPEPDVKGYRVWKKGWLGADEIGKTEAPELVLTRDVVGKGLAIQVSALDADGLESARSEAVNVVAPQP